MIQEIIKKKPTVLSYATYFSCWVIQRDYKVVKSCVSRVQTERRRRLQPLTYLMFEIRDGWRWNNPCEWPIVESTSMPYMVVPKLGALKEHLAPSHLNRSILRNWSEKKKLIACKVYGTRKTYYWIITCFGDPFFRYMPEQNDRSKGFNTKAISYNGLKCELVSK